MRPLHKYTILLLKQWLFLSICIYSLIYHLVLINIALPYPNDFCQDYISAKNILSGKSPYLRNYCFEKSPNFTVFYNPHPPFTFYIYLPLAIFSQSLASGIWSIASGVFYYAACILLVKQFSKISLKNLTAVCAASMLWWPFRNAVVNQNIIELLFLLLTTSWLLEMKNKKTLAGILIGIATLIRLWPGILLLPLIVHKKKETLASALTTIGMGTLLTIPFLNKQDYFAYFQHVRIAEESFILHAYNISTVSQFAKILHFGFLSYSDSLFLAKSSGVVALVAITAIILIFSVKKQGDERAYTLTKSSLLTLVLLLFPVVWLWGLVILILIVAMVQHASKGISTASAHWKNTYHIGLLLIFPLHIISRLSLTQPFKISGKMFAIIYTLDNLLLLFALWFIFIYQIRLMRNILIKPVNKT